MQNVVLGNMWGMARTVSRSNDQVREFFDEQALIERREVFSVNVLSDLEQLRVAVNAQAGFGKLQRPEKNERRRSLLFTECAAHESTCAEIARSLEGCGMRRRR